VDTGRSVWRYWYPVAFGGVVAAIFGWNLYRAFTLAITHDEAATYEWFVAGGPAYILSPARYEANNHVLYSLLAWGSVKILGLSEFSLRLPSVLAGPLLLVGVGRLFRLLSASRMLGLLGLLVVALDPLVMDFQVAARGYGLGLALCLWAWHGMARSLVPAIGPDSGRDERRRFLGVGVAQGLAVGANLVYSFPNLALTLAFVVLTLARRPGERRATLAVFTRYCLLPAAAVALLFSLPILGHLGGDQFYYGTASLAEMASSLAQPTVEALAGRDSWGLPPELPREGPGVWAQILMAAFLATLLPLPVVVYRLYRDPGARLDEWAALSAFLAGGTVVLVVLLVCAHWVFGLVYPRDRTGLYFIPLAVGCWLLVVRKMWESGGGLRLLGGVATAPLVGSVVLFASQLQADYLYRWRFDAGSRRIYHLLAEKVSARPGARIGHDWIFEPGLNFYRVVSGPGPFPPFGRDGPEGDHDYYYLEANTAREWVRAGRIRVIDKDPVSGSVVGVPP